MSKTTKILDIIDFIIHLNNNIFMNHKEEILDQLFAEMYIIED